MTDFIKFPHTPHLLWLNKNSPREDKILSKDEVDDFLKGNIIVEEKVEGANIGLSLSQEGAILVQNRGNYIGHSSHPQFSPLWSWIYEKPGLQKPLSDGLFLFGEWCFARHSVLYKELPDWFLLFDVYDRPSHKFWSAKRRNALGRKTGLKTVPKIAEGIFSRNELLKLISNSSLTDGPMEGIYLRRESDSFLIDRAKIVRPEFIQNMTEHWTKRSLQKNMIIKR